MLGAPCLCPHGLLEAPAVARWGVSRSRFTLFPIPLLHQPHQPPSLVEQFGTGHILAVDPFEDPPPEVWPSPWPPQTRGRVGRPVIGLPMTRPLLGRRRSPIRSGALITRPYRRTRSPPFELLNVEWRRGGVMSLERQIRHARSVCIHETTELKLVLARPPRRPRISLSVTASLVSIVSRRWWTLSTSTSHPRGHLPSHLLPGGHVVRHGRREPRAAAVYLGDADHQPNRRTAKTVS